MVLTTKLIFVIFRQLKHIAGGNLSSTNYVTSLSSLVTQKDVQSNSNAEKVIEMTLIMSIDLATSVFYSKKTLIIIIHN